MTSQVRYLTSPLKFFIYCALSTATLALGFAKFSILPEDFNLLVAKILLTLFVLIIVVSFFLVAFNPSKYLYTREEWIKKEQLTDSTTAESNKSVSNVNVNASPIELSNQIETDSE